MKKIMILANYDMGLYKFRKELLEKLCSEHKVYVCAPKGEYYEKIKSIGCNFIDVDLQRRGTNPFVDARLILIYIKLIKNISPDIVLTYTIKPNVYGGIACRRMKIPYVSNITGLGTAVETSGILQKVTLYLYKIGLGKAKKVFFQNSENRDFMLNNNIVKTSYDLLPGSGVNLNDYTYFEYPDSDTIDFVFVARIMKEKGIDQYIDAAKYITKKYKNVKFHVCGAYENDYKSIIEKLIEENIIIYHGVVDDMKSMYRKMSCTIHPTYYPEGISNVLLESCATGRPIITTNRSGCREVVEDKINGFVVEEKNSQDLINKIEMFISLSWEERKKMGIYGREKVEREFDRSIIIDKYLDEIK